MTLSKAQEAAERLDLARVAFEARMLDEAQTHLHRVLELNPSLPAARVLEARIRLQQNLPRHALAALDAYAFYHPEDGGHPDVVLLRIQGLLRAGLDDLAVTQLEKFAEAFPDDVRPHQMLAALRIKLGQTGPAIESLYEVLRLQPSDRPSRMNLARFLGETDPEVAIDVLRADPHPTDLSVRLRLARLYHLAGRDREADEAYTALLQEAADEEPLALETGQLADSLGDHHRAVRELGRAAHSTSRKNTAAFESLAMAHMHAGETSLATGCWWRAARRNGDNPRAWAGVLVCALAAGRLSLVRRAQKALTVHTSKKERQKMLAELWQHLAGGLVIARTLGRAGETTQDESPLEQLLHKATQTFADQLHDQPRRADTHYHLAVCRDALADTGGARAAVDGALAINPDYAAAVRLRARLQPAARHAA